MVVAPADPSPAAPLHGLTFVAKDVFDVAGTVTGAGNPDWTASHTPADRHADAVAALLEAGARLVGKGGCAEFAYSLSGDNVHYGMPDNPAAPSCDPGGSTSGPAIAVAGGLCDIGLGTDTLGSVRVPASYCGLYGYRPTHGAISAAGVLPLSQRFDTVGLLTRDIGVLRRAAEVLLAGPAAPPAAGVERPRRLLLVREAFASADRRVADVIRDAAAGIAQRLAVPVEGVDLLPDGPDLSAAVKSFSVLQAAQVWANFGEWMYATQPALGPDIAERFAGAARTDSRQVAEAEPVAEAVATAVRRLDRDEVLVLPTAGQVPPGRTDADARNEARHAAGRLTCLASLAGAPALSLPLGHVDDLPVGVSLVAAPGCDRLLLGPVSDPGG